MSSGGNFVFVGPSTFGAGGGGGGKPTAYLQADFIPVVLNNLTPLDIFIDIVLTEVCGLQIWGQAQFQSPADDQLELLFGASPGGPFLPIFSAQAPKITRWTENPVGGGSQQFVALHVLGGVDAVDPGTWRVILRAANNVDPETADPPVLQHRVLKVDLVEYALFNVIAPE